MHLIGCLRSRPPISTVDAFRHERDKKEEAGYVPLPEFYTFNSRDERERILYKNFVQVGEDVKEMKQEIQKYKVKSFL